STSNQNFPSFPDAAYTEFMELISKYHLSDLAGNAVLKWFNKHHLREDVILPKNITQGCEFVNSIYVKHLLYLRIKILKYESEEYYLYHRPVFDAIKELLFNADILKYCQWEFSAEYITNDNGQYECIYGEQWTGLWWK
ncbi:12825_t:CDS:1, partial [Funneliformis caledonium]